MVSPLIKAKRLLSQKRFPQVIKLLESHVFDYPSSFEYNYLLGTACLYVGDIGGAELYYKKARNIKISDVNLINAQAVLFLRRGETAKAVDYYLQTQEYAPDDVLAKKGLEFIKKNGNPETINYYVQSGKIKKLYPKTGFNSKILVSLIPLFICGALLLFFVTQDPEDVIIEKRADLSELVLTIEEKNESLEQDTASSVFRYILTEKELDDSYNKAISSFQKYNDNAAQIEINRILNSNASVAIKQKAHLLTEYFEEPSFNSEIEEVTYEELKNDPWLYLDTWVQWSGRISNVQETELEYRCDLLLGYETLEKMEGIVPLSIQQRVSIDTTLPLNVLAQVDVEDGRLLLRVKSIYQPIEEKK